MINEINFCDHIEAATGKVLGVDYGFMFGTFTPFGAGARGFSSVNMMEGFEVWKYIDNKKNFEKLHIKELHTIEENLKLVIEWLKQ